MAGLGAVHQKLLGNTAADHAGPPDTISLHDRDAGSMAGSAFCSGKPTGARPKNNQIQISAHYSGLLPSILLPMGVTETTGIFVKMALWSGEEGRRSPRRIGRISTASLNHEPFFQAPQAVA